MKGFFIKLLGAKSRLQTKDVLYSIAMTTKESPFKLSDQIILNGKIYPAI